MNAEKIFWIMIFALAAGFFAFLAFGTAVNPVSAAQQANAAAQLGGQAAMPQQAGQLAQVQNGVQVVQLYVQGSSYYPNPIRVKSGVPVRLVGDMARIPGCSRSIVIPEFGVRKVLSEQDNAIEFTPSKAGTFQFSCSMGMYRGTIVVEDAAGTAGNLAGNPQALVGNAAEADGATRAGGADAALGGAPAGSCGMGAGCGCGGRV